MSKEAKETVYVDVEDEITAVIDKVVSSEKKIVAVVLPKRTNVFHSPVNLKLLKKAASKAKKNIVLITTDATVMAVAATSAIHVAKTPTSKPVIPEPKHAASKEEAAKAEAAALAEDMDAIELDNTDPVKAAAAKKGTKIPDFGSFKVKMTIVVLLLIGLIVGWFVMFKVMPRATIIVTTDTRTVPIDTEFTAIVGTDQVDLESNTIPATRVQIEKINKQTVKATGTKNIGNKATGTVTLTNCIDDGEIKVVAAGTQFSKDSLVFVTTEQIILEPALYQGDVCRSSEFPGLGAVGDVPVEAKESGFEYNIPAGNLNSSISGISSYGSQMTGGTTENVTVVSDEDVDSVAADLVGKSKTEALEELRDQLNNQGVMSLDVTFKEGKPETLAKPAVGEETEEVEVTATITFSMLGVKEEYINQMLDNEIQKVVQDETQNVRDNGLNDASFELIDNTNQAESVMSVQAIATIGPDINAEQLKIDMAGKTRGEIEKELESIDGVRSVTVEYSPAWVTTTPEDSNKLIVKIDEEDEQ